MATTRAQSVRAPRRALVLNPPFERAVFRDHYCSSEAKSAYLWHPLDLQIQAAVLHDAGWQVDALDAVALELDHAAVLRRVAASVPDVVVVLVAKRTWASDRELIRRMREAGVGTIVASGDFLRFGDPPSAEAEGLVDIVVTDFTTSELARVLDGAELGLAGGLASVEDALAGRFHDLGRAPCDYPTPDPQLFHPARYRLPYPGFTRFASILTGYGCPYHCAYCHVGELGYRLRPVDAILDELRRADAAGLDTVYFRDATINARKKHVLAWTRRMVDEGLARPWSAFAAARPFDDETAAAMRASGCEHLQIGMESLDDALRDGNDKPFDGDAHRAFVDTCRRHAIQVTAHLVFGLPGETEATLARTVDGLTTAGFDYVAINLAENRPGLPWQERGVELAIDVDRPGDATHGDVPDLPTLKRWQSKGYRRFYLRPERLAQEVRERLRYRDFEDGLGLARDVARWLTG